MKNLYKKIISISLSFSILGMSFFVQPQKVEAGVDAGKIITKGLIYYWVCYNLTAAASTAAIGLDMLSVPTGSVGGKTIDAADSVKSCGLDAAANQIKTQLISGILKSTTEWVKGGYEGKPSFITSPDQFLNEATDRWVADIIENNESTSVLCDSFRIPLKFAVNLNFYKKSDQVNIPSCTMSDIEQNIENALGDLKNFYTDDGLDAGNYWNSFIKTNTTTGGNAYEAYLQVSDDLKEKIDSENQKKLDDINRNGGFMSIERCDDENDGTYAGDASNRICGQKLTSCLSDAKTDEEEKSCNSAAKRCIQDSIGKKNCEYITPGKVISDEVTSVLGMERENLQMADEFDELISVIITQLMSKVFDSNQGLSGINRSGDDSDYEPSTERDISVEKASMLKQYSPRAYDIQLKIYQTLLDILTGIENIFPDTISIILKEEEYWKDKNDLQVGTESAIDKYWSYAGGNEISDWNTAFISYISNGGVKPIIVDNKVVDFLPKYGAETKETDYKWGEAAILPGTIICNFKNKQKVFCDVVIDAAMEEDRQHGNAIAIGVHEFNNGGIVSRTLKRKNIALGPDTGLADKTDMAIFTPPAKLNSEKYNTEYYKKLFGEGYTGPMEIDYDAWNNNNRILSEALVKWEEFQSRFALGDDGATYLVWDGPTKGKEIAESGVDEVVKAYKEAGVTTNSDSAINIAANISEAEIENIKRLRDETIKDRDNMFEIAEDIKKAETINELWEVGGNTKQPNLQKAYKIYQRVLEKLGIEKGQVGITDDIMTGVAADAEGEPGHKKGLAPYTAMLHWFFDGAHTASINEIDEINAVDGQSTTDCGVGEPARSKICLFGGSIDVTDWAQRDTGPNGIDSTGLVTAVEFPNIYDPIDDITDWNTGLYDEDYYDYSGSGFSMSDSTTNTESTGGEKCDNGDDNKAYQREKDELKRLEKAEKLKAMTLDPVIYRLYLEKIIEDKFDRLEEELREKYGVDENCDN